MNCHQALLARKKKAAALKATGNAMITSTSPSTSASNASANKSFVSSYPLSNQNSLPLNPSASILPQNGPKFHTASPSVPVHPPGPTRTASFKEKSLPSLPPSEMSSLPLPIAPNPQFFLNSESVQLKRSNTTSSIKSNSSINGLSHSLMSPPSRPSKQPAFDPALARIPQRSGGPPVASRNASNSSQHTSGAGARSGSISSLFPTSAHSGAGLPSNISTDNSSPAASISHTSTIAGSSFSNSSTIGNLADVTSEYPTGQFFTPYSTSSNNLNRNVSRKSSDSNSNANNFETLYSQSNDFKGFGSNQDPILSLNKRNELIPSVPLESLLAISPSARGGMYVDSSLSSPVGNTSLEESVINELRNRDIEMLESKENSFNDPEKITLKQSDSPNYNLPTSHSKNRSGASSATLRQSDTNDTTSSMSHMSDGEYDKGISDLHMLSSNQVKSEKTPGSVPIGTDSNDGSTTSSYSQSVDSLHPTLRELYDARARIAELEQQLNARENSRKMDTNINEKRKTIAGLEAKGTVAKRELQLLADAISHKDNLMNSRHELISAFTTDLSEFKRSLQAEIEVLMFERDKLVEERNRLFLVTSNLTTQCNALEERHLQVAYQVNQLHDLHIELAKQAMQKFGATINTKPFPNNGKEEYTLEEATPHVIDVSTDDKKERVHGRRFWKRPTAAVAKGVKGFNKVFAPDQSHQFVTTGPYVDGNSYTAFEDDVPVVPDGNEIIGDGSRQRNAWFNKNSSNETTALTNSEPPSLMGYDIEQRIAYEQNSIPLIVTRCIQEVEERGMEYEGIYRKSGGRSQISAIESAFEKHSNNSNTYDLDEVLSGDIAGVTSALKQYLRHLPNPLVTFESYDDFVEASKQIPANPEGVADQLQSIINELPQAYKECLSVVCSHLNKISKNADINLMTVKNLAVVFAPTLVRHTNGERELLDMAPRNDGTQLMIEKCSQIFADVVVTVPPKSAQHTSSNGAHQTQASKNSNIGLNGTQDDKALSSSMASASSSHTPSNTYDDTTSNHNTNSDSCNKPATSISNSNNGVSPYHSSSHGNAMDNSEAHATANSSSSSAPMSNIPVPASQVGITNPI